MSSKCVLLLLDGLGDRSYTEFGDQTPLQKAHTPNLDKLANLGGNGLYHAGIPGQALPSEMAHFSLFGYEQKDFPGRGPLEALGGGVDLQPRDVALMAHLVSLQESEGCLRLYKDRPKANQEEIFKVSRKIREYEKRNIKVEFQATDKTFGVLVLKGRVTPYITDSDPLQENANLAQVRPWEEYEEDLSSLRTCAVLNSYLVYCYHALSKQKLNKSRQLAGNAPINGVVTQRAGWLSEVKSFWEKWGLKGTSVSSGTIYRGLSRFLGLDFSDSREHADPEQEIEEKLLEAYNCLDKYDFIHVHSKWPDKAAHSKDPQNKKEVIEGLDRGIGKVMDSFLSDPAVLLVVTADHSTPSSGKIIHSGEPVPLTFCGSGVRRDKLDKYDEVSLSSGSLGFLRGNEIMYSILNHLDRIKLSGIRDAPADNPYTTHNYTPLDIHGYQK